MFIGMEKMDNSKNRHRSDPDKDSILNNWLGLPDDKKVQKTHETQKLEDQLAKLSLKNPQGSFRDVPALNRAYRKLITRLEEPTTSEKILSYFRKLLNPLYLAPAFAIALTVVGVVFVQNNQQSLELQIVKGPNVDIQSKIYSSPDFLTVGKMGNITLSMRSVSDLRAVNDETQTILYFKAGKLLTEYNNQANEKKLTIQTDRARYVVTGTKFLIDAGKEEDKLYVFEGKVTVYAKDGYAQLRENQWWRDKHEYQSFQDEAIVKQAEEQFLASNNDLSIPASTRLVNKENTNVREETTLKPSTRDLISFHLTNGEIINGEIILDSNGFYQVKIAGIDKVVKIDKSQVAKLIRPSKTKKN